MTVQQLLDYPRRWVRGMSSKRTGEFVVDMFAGGGGTSCGIKGALGRDADVAMNHDKHAIEIHRLNHPDTHHFLCDVREVNPREVMPERPIGLLWLSPDCTHHSRAKGGKPAKRNRRALANVGIVWAAARKPRVIILENVEEFEGWGPLDDKGQPLKNKKGQSFKRWVNRLKRLGYEVQWRSLVAADYGAPTIRKRLFLIARCDGQKIIWPQQTHCKDGDMPLLGLKQWRAAYECIDFSIPTRSIFERKKELALATQKRIHAGILKYVFVNPFIVKTNHTGEGFRGQSVDDPLQTIVGHNEGFGLVTPSLIQMGFGESKGQAPRTQDIKKPLSTITGQGIHSALTHAHLMAIDNVGAFRPQSSPMNQPVRTITTENRHALVEAFMVKFKKNSDAKPMQLPIDSMTTKASNGMIAAHLQTFRGTSKSGRDLREPMPSLTAGGNHVAEVRAFLIKYFRTGVARSLKRPAPTLTAKHRLGLVEVHGQQYQINDLHLRMLTPRELLRAQFGKYADGYILTGNQAQQVKAIGNSVPPEVAEALVRANVKLQ